MHITEETMLRFLTNLFIQRGWMVESITDRNLCADLLVCVSKDNAQTMAYFFASIKIVDDFAGDPEERKSGNVVTSTISVKNVKLWNVSPIVYISFICSKNSGENIWIDSDSVNEQLKQTSSGNWKEKKSVRVKIPLSNNLGPDGISRLGQLVLRHSDKFKNSSGSNHQIRIGFTFPSTPAGRENREALNSLIRSGGAPLTLGNEYISEFNAPFWWTNEPSASRPASVTITQSSSVPVRLELISDDGSAQIPHMELRRLGPEQFDLTMSRSERRSPIRFTIHFARAAEENKIKANFRFSIKGLGADVYETFEMGKIMLVLSAANRMKLFVQKTNQLMLDNPMPSFKMRFSIDELRARQALMEKLVFIQTRIAQHGIISMKNRNIEKDDIGTINKMYAICKDGKFVGSGSLSMGIDLTDFAYNALKQSFRENETNQKPSELMIKTSQSKPIKVFNVTVPLGEVRLKCKITKFHTEQFIQQIDTAIAEGKSDVQVALKDLETEEEYPEWLPAN